MITAQQENDRLTRVGPGTLVGGLLRRYWYPVAATAQLQDEPIAVDLLGEELVLYRDNSGALGLLARGCGHRQTSLVHGIPEESGLRCAYHGWVWDAKGNCLEQPSEPADSTFYQKVKTTAYPVRELGGLIFAYLGPGPAPVLPPYNVLVWEHSDRATNGTIVPCNWLQVIENLFDPSHIENLHGRYFGHVLDRTDPNEAAFFRARFTPAPVKSTRFDLFADGIIERHYCRDEEEHSWRNGSPIFFPTTAMVARDSGSGTLIFVVPLDDERTWFVEHRAWPSNSAAGAAEGAPEVGPRSVPFYDIPGMDAQGEFLIATANGQDHMAVVTQGRITDRSKEHLGTTDAGLIMYRQLLLDQAHLVADGGQPMNVRRTAAQRKRIDCPVPEPVLTA